MLPQLALPSALFIMGIKLQLKENDLIQIYYNPQLKYKGYFLGVKKFSKNHYFVKIKNLITEEIESHIVSNDTKIFLIGKVKNYIYLITCKVNGKQYIGRTSTSVEERFKSHWYESKKSFFYSPLHGDMRKYGKENFVVETLYEYYADRQKDANKVEQEFIRKYNTAVPNGYNVSVFGGDKNAKKNG